MSIRGFWSGEYAYDAPGMSKVEFQAELEQLGAILEGTSTEQNTFDEGAGQILIAELFGKVSGKNISFTKSYTNVSQLTDKVIYKGSISDDGHLITGSWVISLIFSGSFRMTRAIEQKPREQIATANETEDA